MTNCHISDQPRHDKVMKMLHEFAPNVPRGTWHFFVQSHENNVVFKCVSPKRVVTKKE